MPENIHKKIFGFHRSLIGQQRVFTDAIKRKAYLGPLSVKMLEEEIIRIEKDFPELLPKFRTSDFLERDVNYESYNLPAIVSYLAIALARLEAEKETFDATPVTEPREFSFVEDPRLRTILERDYSEIQRSYVSRCWKSVIILSGGAIEAILTDLLLQKTEVAKSSARAPKEPNIGRWDLNNLIEVCVDIKLVGSGVEKLSQSVRHYRNIVHPGYEIRNKLTFDAEEARIALEVLNIVHRDLSK